MTLDDLREAIAEAMAKGLPGSAEVYLRHDERPGSNFSRTVGAYDVRNALTDDPAVRRDLSRLADDHDVFVVDSRARDAFAPSPRSVH